ncbi:MAG: 8-oxo-dGTP diphosphatase [Bacteroidales bacterium]|nr:8-oxo-dGTP diphosphatase [Bacteroidales bacterium]
MKQTTLCYLDDGERYLMLHRTKKDHDASHGKWIGVGGKCEADESPDECMLREVKEETGLAVTSWRYRGIVTFISDTWDNEYMHLFTADRWEGELDMDCNEGDLAWIPKSDLPLLPGMGNTDINLWEGDKIFLRLLMDEGQPFFSLKLIYVQDEMAEARLDGQHIGTQASCLRDSGCGEGECVPDCRRQDACVPELGHHPAGCFGCQRAGVPRAGALRIWRQEGRRGLGERPGA